MNVGFIYGMATYPPKTGGSIHGYQLTRGLAARGHRLFSWFYGTERDPNVTHLRGRQLGRFLRTIDVLYVRINWNTIHARLSCLRLLRRLPVVWELNGLPEEIVHCGGTQRDQDRVVRKLRFYARFADAGIGVTQRVTDFLRDDLGIESVRCIANGSDPERFFSAPAPAPAPGEGEAEHPLRVVWIGTSKFGWHDLETFLAAARLVEAQSDQVQFTIYGDAEHLPKDLPANVKCPGRVPYQDMPEHLAQADVGVHLFKPLPGGLIDGSPLKLFDYMASGLAVVAQQAGQTGQILSERQAGQFTTGQADDLAETILRLQRDRALCRQLGENGRRAVTDYYNWGRAVDETADVLDQLRRGDTK